jgi:hypothetical protein
MAKEIIETHYAKKRAAENFKSVASYADFRELLEKEKDLDSVKIMTPDHLHATISLAAMKKRKHVLIHKPLSNRVAEVRMVVEGARKTGVATHLLAWRSPSDAVDLFYGAIGALKCTTDRPPVLAACPESSHRYAPVPAGFDWDLWLGPSLNAVPSQLHACGFRGWYEFGGGSIVIWELQPGPSLRLTCRCPTLRPNQFQL